MSTITPISPFRYKPLIALSTTAALVTTATVLFFTGGGFILAISLGIPGISIGGGYGFYHAVKKLFTKSKTPETDDLLTVWNRNNKDSVVEQYFLRNKHSNLFGTI